MGGVVKAATGAPGILAGKIGDSGDRAKRDYEDQLAGLDAGPRPGTPQFANLLNAQTGLLSDQYNLKDSSSWRKAMMDQQGQEELGARDLAQNLAQTQAAQTRSQLASRGGLRGGAGERAAQAAGRTAAEQQQMATRAGAQTRANVGVKGEELDRQAQQFNISNALAEQQRQDQLKQDQYASQMGQWAAGKQAQATFQAGKGKGQGGGVGGGVAKTVGK